MIGPGEPFQSRMAFRQALREAFAFAADQGCRRIWLIDPDFGHWPLDEPEVLGSLQRWALPHRRLTLIAHHFDGVARERARFVAWRRLWSHVVECRAWPKEEGELPSLWLAPDLRAVRLLDPVSFRGGDRRGSRGARAAGRGLRCIFATVFARLFSLYARPMNCGLPADIISH